MNIKYSMIFVCWVSLCVGSDVKTIIEPILAQAQQLAFEHVQNRSKSIPVIAIAGCSSVGKSYFAAMVAHELRHRGFNIFVLHQDDYLNKDHIFAGFKIHPNLDHDLLHAFLSQNRAGIKRICKPCAIDQCYFKNKIVNIERVDLIVFEGIYALTGPETYDFVQYSSLGVFLDASTSHIVKWHAARNKKRPFFKRLGNSDIRQHATCLLYEYVQFILPSKKNAQFTLYKDGINTYRLVS